MRVVAHGGAVVHGVGRPGRGAWVHPTPECVQHTIRRRALPRALRSEVVVSVDDLAAVVGIALEEVDDGG